MTDEDKTSKAGACLDEIAADPNAALLNKLLPRISGARSMAEAWEMKHGALLARRRATR